MTAELEAARLLLDRLGVDPSVLLDIAPHDVARHHDATPTFAAYIPRVTAAVTPGALRTYRPYWRRLSERWPDRRLNEPTATELQAIVEEARQTAVVRRNTRGGRSAAEHMVGAIRCLYGFAVRDGYILAASNPSLKLNKPRRLRSPRHALAPRQLSQITDIVATTGNDPELDTLIIRIHLETACRTGTALKIRRIDIDEDNCLVRLHGKGGTLHWQPISPTLTRALIDHAERSPDPAGQLLRYRSGKPITRRRYDHIWERVGRRLKWVATQQVSTHWIRHTTLTWIERRFGYAVAATFAAHATPTGPTNPAGWAIPAGPDGATLTYVVASIEEVAAALSALTGEPHPLAPGTREPDPTMLGM
ncbi:tyrosine-type recombinase/integrase [Nocardia puris]|uniref:tyrosine-type recombinase/integrase n=1 Tax=Nocardia puris TaxID=208602 RepID=UPI002E24D952